TSWTRFRLRQCELHPGAAHRALPRANEFRLVLRPHTDNASQHNKNPITFRQNRLSLMKYVKSADSELTPAGIPINYRPPFRFEAGHDSNQLSAVFRL